MDRKTIETPLKEYVKTYWSDIDLLVLTKRKNHSIKKLTDKLLDIGHDIKTDHLFDIRILSSKEYEKASHLTIYNEVKREGILVYQR